MKKCKMSKIYQITDPVQWLAHLLLLVNNRSVLLIGAPKNRPASMDLLLLQSHRSTSDRLPTSGCQMPCLPTGSESEERDHVSPEYEGLYERVGVWRAPPPAPLLNTIQSQSITENRRGGGGGGAENRGLNEAVQAEMMAEYASVRKVRKLERGRRQEGSEEENTSASSNTMEPFHIPNFPKVNTQIQSAKSQLVTE